MRIVIPGSTGLIGSRLIMTLRAAGHEAVAASPESGFDSDTGVGLREVLRGTTVVVDVSEPASVPACLENEMVRCVTASTRTLLGCEDAAGVTHHVAVSAVSIEELLKSSYFRARCAQERLVKASTIRIRSSAPLRFAKIRIDDWLRRTRVHASDPPARVHNESASLARNEFRVREVPPGSV